METQTVALVRSSWSKVEAIAPAARLDDLPSLVPVLETLAVRHSGYGVREPHHDRVGAALLETLRQGLADDFTTPVRDAWAQVYGLVSRVMVDAARRHGDAAAAAHA